MEELLLCIVILMSYLNLINNTVFKETIISELLKIELLDKRIFDNGKILISNYTYFFI